MKPDSLNYDILSSSQKLNSKVRAHVAAKPHGGRKASVYDTPTFILALTTLSLQFL